MLMLYQMFYFIGLAIVFLAIIFVFVCFTMLKMSSFLMKFVD